MIGMPAELLMIMIARLDGRDSVGLNLVETLLVWMKKGLVPAGLSLEEEVAYGFCCHRIRSSMPTWIGILRRIPFLSARCFSRRRSKRSISEKSFWMSV